MGGFKALGQKVSSYATVKNQREKSMKKLKFCILLLSTVASNALMSAAAPMPAIPQHSFSSSAEENSVLWEEINAALNELMYDTAQLFRYGQSGDPALVNELLDNLMSHFSKDLTSFVVNTLISTNLTTYNQVKAFYLDDATNNYDGYVLHQMSNVIVQDTTASSKGAYTSKHRTASMSAFQVEFARVFAAPGVGVNLLVVGDYFINWVREDGQWKVATLLINDDRIYNMESLVVYQNNYSGTPSVSPALPPKNSKSKLKGRFYGIKTNSPAPAKRPLYIKNKQLP